MISAIIGLIITILVTTGTGCGQAPHPTANVITAKPLPAGVATPAPVVIPPSSNPTPVVIAPVVPTDPPPAPVVPSPTLTTVVYPLFTEDSCTKVMAWNPATTILVFNFDAATSYTFTQSGVTSTSSAFNAVVGEAGDANLDAYSSGGHCQVTVRQYQLIGVAFWNATGQQTVNWQP